MTPRLSIYLVSFLSTVLCFPNLAYSQLGSMSGFVLDHNNAPIPFASVALLNTPFGTQTDENGAYKIQNIEPGNYIAAASFVGYDIAKQSIEITPAKQLKIHFKLKQGSIALDEFEIIEKTKSQQLRESAFTIDAIDVKPLQNLNLDMNQVLNRSMGIRIREEGGMGSGFNFSLNGFSGKQIKFFMDGIPMESFGSSMTLNNIPVNLIERVEVYKGVVPIYLGADALGGAVNVVTNNNVKDFIDASYSIGSFNTHKASFVARYTGKNNFVLNTNLFYNFSENNYKVDVEIPDPESGKIDGTTEVRRFNDGYISTSAYLEVGFVKKKWADKFLVGAIVSGNEKEIQTGPNMTQVAGEARTSDKALIGTIKYAKEDFFIKKLDFNFSGSYNFRDALTVDTSSRKYSWDGTYVTKTTGVYSGELYWSKTLFSFNDNAAQAQTNLRYTINSRHFISLNNAFSSFSRVGEDPLSHYLVPYSDPNVLTKNIAGISYNNKLFEERWVNSVFAKAFYMNANVFIENEETDQLDNLTTTYFKQGFGLASTFFINKSIQLKASAENTYRLPEGYEMFGNGLLLESNPLLEPEKSLNLNAGILIQKDFKKHRINFETNYFHRKPENMIRLKAKAVTSVYENLSSARVDGVESGLKYVFDQKLMVELNGTYQNIVNTNLYEGDQRSSIYLDRIPNTPFLFGNAMFSYQLKDKLAKGSNLSANYSMLFVEAFYLKWPSQGSSAFKYDIPRQISHEVSLSLSLKQGKYSISATCANLLDAQRFDNFRLQKPGRSFSLKIRYLFIKNYHK